MSTATASYRDLVVQAAGPLSLGENVKSALCRVARTTGLSPRRVRSIWNNEITDLRGRELDALRAAAARRAQEKPDEMVAIARDMEALAQRVAALASPADRKEAEQIRLLAERTRRLAAGV